MSDFVIENGVLTTYTQKCPCEDVIVPEGVIAIANNVFCGTDIRSIRLPGSLTKVGEGWHGTSFENCEKLETVCIEDGQAYIEGLRFRG